MNMLYLISLIDSIYMHIYPPTCIFQFSSGGISVTGGCTVYSGGLRVRAAGVGISAGGLNVTGGIT